MGKSSSIEIGVKYFVAWHVFLAKRVDALLEVRGGDKTAWSGNVSASTMLTINQPELFGGDTDQGGMVGTLAVMMGEADQTPNTYLTATFGDRTVAWRGFTTLAWQGGEYGSNNPYPFKMSAKTFSCYQIWDEVPGWYPETAAVLLDGATEGSDPIELDYTGGESFPNIIPVELGDALGPVYLDYATGPNPDKFELWIDGEKVLDTGYHGTGGIVVPTIGPGTLQEELDAYLTGLSLPTETIVEIPGSYTSATDQWDSVTDRETASFFKSTPTSMATLKIYSPLDSTIWVARMRRPEIGGSGAYAMNPVHIIVHAHTQSEMGRQPLESIDDASARAAADWYFAQGFGINVRQKVANESPADLIKRVERVAGLSFTRDMSTGLWNFYVANGEYDLESLPVLTDDDIVSFKETPTLPNDAINSVQVKYFDPDRKETVSTPWLRALGQVDLYGEIQQTYDFPEIPTGAIANRVAWREALGTITPSRRFDLVAKPTGAAGGINKGQYFRLQLAKRGIADMVCIMGDKKEGTLKSGNLDLTVAQDVYSLPGTVYSAVEHGVDTRPSQVPVAIADQLAFEAPYIEVCTRLSHGDLDALPPGVGFLCAAAVVPARSRDFMMTVAPSGGDYEDAAVGDFCPSAIVNESAGFPETNFTLSGASQLASVEVGDPVIWGAEWCRVDAIDAVALTITLGRGCADTVRQPHDAGERLFFYRDGAAYDTSEHIDGEDVDIKLLTNTGSQRLDASLATAMSLTFGNRLALPYPPAQVAIGGSPAPTSVSGDIVVTWVHRDRDLQADQLLDDTDGGVGPNAYTRIGLRFYDASATLLVEKLDISGTTATGALSVTGDVRMVLFSVNDSGESWQMHERIFAYTSTGGMDTITAATWVAPTWVIDGNGG